MSFLSIDVDEVLADYLRPFLRWHNKQYGTNYTIDDIWEWDIYNVFQISREEETKRLMAFETNLNMAALPPLPGAVDAITALWQRYSLIAVTSRSNQLRDVTLAWLHQWFDKRFSAVLYTDHDMHNPPKFRKSQLIRPYDALVHVDDSLKHCTECAAAGIPAILFGEYKYNQGKVPALVTRVSDWQKAGSYLLQIVPPAR